MASAAQLEQAGGYALIYRRIIDNPVFRNPSEAMAFAYLVLMASWKPARTRYRQRELLLERGQVAMSVRDFAAAMDRSKDWAQRFLDRLEAAGMIVRRSRKGCDSAATESETGGATAPNVISVCNYDKYQSIDGETATVNGTVVATGGATQNNTRIQTPSKDNNKLLSKGSPKRATAWTADKFPDDWLLWPMSNLGWSKVQAISEGHRFMDSAMAKRRTYVDWFAAWRQWCRSPFQKTVASKQERLTL